MDNGALEFIEGMPVYDYVANLDIVCRFDVSKASPALETMRKP